MTQLMIFYYGLVGPAEGISAMVPGSVVTTGGLNQLDATFLLNKTLTFVAKVLGKVFNVA